MNPLSASAAGASAPETGSKTSCRTPYWAECTSAADNNSGGTSADALAAASVASGASRECVTSARQSAVIRSVLSASSWASPMRNSMVGRCSDNRTAHAMSARSAVPPMPRSRLIRRS